MIANVEIRDRVQESGLTYTEIAQAMGISRVYLSRIMSKPLTLEKKLRVLAAIEELLEERSG